VGNALPDSPSLPSDIRSGLNAYVDWYRFAMERKLAARWYSQQQTLKGHQRRLLGSKHANKILDDLNIIHDEVSSRPSYDLDEKMVATLCQQVDDAVGLHVPWPELWIFNPDHFSLIGKIILPDVFE
jgi:hypothetical protein